MVKTRDFHGHQLGYRKVNTVACRDSSAVQLHPFLLAADSGVADSNAAADPDVESRSVAGLGVADLNVVGQSVADLNVGQGVADLSAALDVEGRSADPDVAGLKLGK